MIAVLARNLRRTPTSFRAMDWLCDHDYFISRNVELVVLTGAHYNYHNQSSAELSTYTCGVVVQQFRILDADRAQQFISLVSQLENGSERLQVSKLDTHDQLSADYAALQRFICSGVTALVVENTYGDDQSTVAMLASKDRCPVTATATTRQSPLVLMDLPNKVIPPHWHGLIDVIVAPSRATGMHAATTTLGKPIAMIYPPVRQRAVVSSPCLLQLPYAPNSTTADSNTGKATLVSRPLLSWPRYKACADCQSGLSGDSRDNIQCNKQRCPLQSGLQAEHNAAAVFHYVYVGRLESDKCPGILLRAIAYLLNYPISAAIPHTAYSTSTDSSRHEGIVSEMGTAASLSMPEQFPFTSYEELQQFRRHSHFTFFGDGSLQQALERMAAELNISDAVSFAGHLPLDLLMSVLSGSSTSTSNSSSSNNTASSDDIGSITDNDSNDFTSSTPCAGSPEPSSKVLLSGRGADVLVNPIVVGETFGYIHTEAALLGIPVVAFRAAANAESIQQGLLVDYRYGKVVQDLAHAMVSIYQQRESGIFTAEKLCAAAFAVQHHWHSSAHSEALIQTIEQIQLTSSR